MQLDDIIARLEHEAAQLRIAIAALKGIPAGVEQRYPGKRRGRKSMPSEERKEVSERMKKYWASRRRAQLRSAQHG